MFHLWKYSKLEWEIFIFRFKKNLIPFTSEMGLMTYLPFKYRCKKIYDDVIFFEKRKKILKLPKINITAPNESKCCLKLFFHKFLRAQIHYGFI